MGLINLFKRTFRFRSAFARKQEQNEAVKQALQQNTEVMLQLAAAINSIAAVVNAARSEHKTERCVGAVVQPHPTPAIAASDDDQASSGDVSEPPVAPVAPPLAPPIAPPLPATKPVAIKRVRREPVVKAAPAPIVQNPHDRMMEEMKAVFAQKKAMKAAKAAEAQERADD